MKLNVLFHLIVFLPLTLISREITIKKSLYWDKVQENIIEGKLSIDYLRCHPCGLNIEKSMLPEFSQTFSLASNEYIKSVRFVNIISLPIDDYSFKSEVSQSLSGATPEVSFSEGTSNKKVFGLLSFIPLVEKNGSIQKISSFELVIEVAGRRISSAKALTTFKTNSVLSTGTWYKIAVDHDAMYKLSYKFLDEQGIDLANIDPRNISIYGNGGAMLPRKNSDYRPDDLIENAIYVKGEADASFDKSDYIVFFGQGPHKWKYHDGDKVFNHLTHQYSDTSYYFLSVDGVGGKRINQTKRSNSPSVVVTSFDDYKYHELDKVNLINSGDDWFGEVFDIQTSFSFPLSFPNIDASSQGFLIAAMANATKLDATWTVSVPGASMQIAAPFASGGYGQQFATLSKGSMTFNPSTDVINVNVTFNKPPSLSSAKGWLDYIEINVRRKLIITGTQTQFRDLNSEGQAYAQFNVKGAKSKTRIFDVTDPGNVVEHLGSLSGSTMFFVNNAQELHTYIAINDYDSTYAWRGITGNQNLHADKDFDYILISHPRFLPAAQRLKAIHEAEGLKVSLTTPQKIYNEFSSGAQDIVAIRDYIRMIYNRSITSNTTGPRYLLLMGDGSVDNKYRISGNSNYIPTFESDNSVHPASSYVSDDFYCLLDSNEGQWVIDEVLDISVGRMPVQTIDQANAAVTKIERYISSQAMKDWRNTICFVADDEDGGLHMRDANHMANIIDTSGPQYNVEKIYIDAYTQYSTPGGARYPDAREAIKRLVERGVLIINYTGHGGEVGWAHERILTLDEVNNWTNRYSLSLFFTATCEFSRWDDPGRTSAGEIVFLNPDGGGIALLTTVRLVYAFANKQLSEVFYKNVFKKINGEMPRLGDIYKEVKTQRASDKNARNFTLLGDPGLRLAYPYYNAVTTSINGKPVSQIDTIGALGLVEIKGHIEDLNGNKLTQYNGTIYPTIFDKRYDVKTRGNDGPQGAISFNIQNKKLFRGKASVTAGDFTFKFVVPKDIAYNYDKGKISYYGENLLIDANGYSDDFIVGGTDPNAEKDDLGPEIELYMNDYTFIYGGITDESPMFIAKVFDEHGINMAGTGIGHDITVVLDNKTAEPISLNDYYSASVNSYKDGEVRYPFEDLSAGPHKLTFKAWDVYNNSSEAVLEFVVEEYKDITLAKVLNYPNPFTTHTSFWFEHNQPNTVLDVKIQIFTISGKVVKTIDEVIQTVGYNQNLNNPISWDGLDEYGDKLGKGVYIYKLKVRSRRNGTSAEKIEKLVIL